MKIRLLKAVVHPDLGGVKLLKDHECDVPEGVGISLVTAGLATEVTEQNDPEDILEENFPEHEDE